jgi:DNA invertase Pin-like site-specific DNA recombinase
MKAAIYVRVSTAEQTTDNQLLALRQLAQARGYEVVAEISETVSGAKKGRPGLDRLVQGAHEGRYQVVLVWAMDRLGRSMHSTIQTVLALDARKVLVVSLREPWLEMGGPTRDLLISIFAWVAEQERRSIIERTNAGLSRARKEGKRLGRPTKPIDLDAALKLRARGMSIRDVASKLGCGVGTLHRALAAEMLPSKKGSRRSKSPDMVSAS